MVATVEICESNGATETVTHNISNMNYGSTDAANITVASYKITVGNNSYFKLQRLHVTDMGGSTSIDNVRVWKSAGAYLTGEAMVFSCHTTQGTYDTYKVTSFSQPDATTYSGNAFATSEPGTANLGIGGSLTGSLTATGYTDYMKNQLQTTGSTPPGSANQKTISWKYDES